jgi:hypothetical protein
VPYDSEGVIPELRRRVLQTLAHREDVYYSSRLKREESCS